MTVTDRDLELFTKTIKSVSSYDFGDYSEKSLLRRLDKVMSDNSMDINSFTSKLKSDKNFLERIVKDITVNTTELFRDPKAWHTLRYRILPKLAKKTSFNIWHAGCSTGQEVYSMMILLYELGLFDKANIYASDLNTDVIETAKKGHYKYRFNLLYLDNFDKVIKENPYNYDEYRDVPYSKYFEINKIKDTISMHQFLREKPTFKKHNLVTDPNPFYVKFDLILCRNVIIYFNYDLQNKVFDLYYKNLNDKSYLLLGMHETILGPYASKFDKKGLIYRKKM